MRTIGFAGVTTIDASAGPVTVNPVRPDNGTADGAEVRGTGVEGAREASKH